MIVPSITTGWGAPELSIDDRPDDNGRIEVKMEGDEYTYRAVVDSTGARAIVDHLISIYGWMDLQ